MTLVPTYPNVNFGTVGWVGELQMNNTKSKVLWGHIRIFECVVIYYVQCHTFSWEIKIGKFWKSCLECKKSNATSKQFQLRCVIRFPRVVVIHSVSQNLDLIWSGSSGAHPKIVTICARYISNGRIMPRHNVLKLNLKDYKNPTFSLCVYLQIWLHKI